MCDIYCSIAVARIAVVTGGSKGIGLGVCKQLAASGITVVLTARDETRGMAAVEQIKQLGHSDVIFHQLDITDASSIAPLADFLKTRFEKLDILVGFSLLNILCLSIYIYKYSGGSLTSELQHWTFFLANKIVFLY